MPLVIAHDRHIRPALISPRRQIPARAWHQARRQTRPGGQRDDRGGLVRDLLHRDGQRQVRASVDLCRSRPLRRFRALIGDHHSYMPLIPSQPIDEIRTGGYRHLFHPELLISGKEDAANNCEDTRPGR